MSLRLLFHDMRLQPKIKTIICIEIDSEKYSQVMYFNANLLDSQSKLYRTSSVFTDTFKQSGRHFVNKASTH